MVGISSYAESSGARLIKMLLLSQKGIILEESQEKRPTSCFKKSNKVQVHYTNSYLGGIHVWLEYRSAGNPVYS